MRKKIAKMLLVVYLLSQSIGMIQAKTLIMDGKKIEYNLPPISLYVNKKLVQTTVMEPIQLNDRVLVPAREVFEAMGATVQWNNSIKQVTVEYKNKNIVLVVNQTVATINGASVSMDVPGKIINDKVMIPVRFVSEAIGMKVDWDATNRAVRIEEPTSVDTEESQSVPQIQQVTTKVTNEKFVATVTASSAMGEIKVSTLTDKVIVDIVNSKSLLNQRIDPVDNTYVTGIRTSQFTADTTRIVLDLKTQVEIATQFSSDRKSFEVTLTKKNTGNSGTSGNDTTNNGSGGTNNGTSGNDTTNNGSATTTPGSLYTVNSKPTLNLAGVTSSKIKVTDDYRNKTLVFDLGADYSKTIPNTELKPNDAYVSSISVKTSGTTKVTVVTKTIYTYQLTQNNGASVVQLVRPREKYKQIVVIDIGHGGSDAGAVGNGLTEKAINFNQGMALYELLEANPNIKVYMTRETDVYPTLEFRSRLANEIDADLFVSIHNNSSSNSSVTGAETLYYPSATDKRGQSIATLVQNSIVKCGMKDRGIKARSDLYVLRTTNMPAILLETGFISNASEAQLINSSSFIKKWSQGVYEAIIEGFKLLQR